MKINIDEIPDNGLSLDLKEEGQALADLAGGKLEFSFASPVEAHMDLNKSDGNLFVDGDIKAGIKLNCSRCLKEFEHPLGVHFTEFFVREKETGREKELKAADMEVNYLTGNEIDTSEVILGQLSLEVPMQPLCREDCKGLCPRCGADLNLGECGCGKEGKVDSRFAKLKDFKAK